VIDPRSIVSSAYVSSALRNPFEIVATIRQTILQFIGQVRQNCFQFIAVVEYSSRGLISSETSSEPFLQVIGQVRQNGFQFIAVVEV
jgi:hypothetical protein